MTFAKWTQSSTWPKSECPVRVHVKEDMRLRSVSCVCGLHDPSVMPFVLIKSVFSLTVDLRSVNTYFFHLNALILDFQEYVTSVEAFTLTPPPQLSLRFSASPGGAVWLRVDKPDHEKVYTPEGVWMWMWTDISCSDGVMCSSALDLGSSRCP